MKNLIEYVKSTSYGTRSGALAVLALVLLIVGWATGASWLNLFAEVSFWGSMFFWGAEFGERKEALKNLRKLKWYSGPTKSDVVG